MIKTAFIPPGGANTKKYFKIGEAASLLGLSSETLRRWERAGKVQFSRTPGGKRLFSEADLEAIRTFLHEPTHPVKNLNLSSNGASKPIQTSTNMFSERRVTFSVSIPKFSFPKFNFKFNFTKLAIACVILILLGGNLFLFSKTPYSRQAVLGAETFIAPALEAEGPIGSLLSRITALVKSNPVSSFVVTVLPKVEQITNVSPKETVVQKVEIPQDLKVTTLSSGDITGNTLKITEGAVIGSLSISNLGDITGANDISSKTITTSGNTSVGGNLTVTGNTTLTGTLTTTGAVNGLSSSTLAFSGSSPSIYPTTTNSQISLNASGTGAINIGNSSTGDIYIGGGGTTGTYCLITNSNGSLNCNGDITTGSNLHVNGGTFATGATTFNLLPDTATTINLGGGATTLSIGSSTGTTTVNNALTVTGTGTLNGNLVLGASSSNTLALNAKVTTSILPNLTGNVDLGSSSLKWNNLYSNTINTASINTSGQGVFNNNPPSTAITDASLLINPTSVTNDTSALLGVAVGGVEKARIDNNGNLTLQGGITASGTTSNTSTGTTGNQFSFTDNSLTTGTLTSLTFTNNSAAAAGNTATGLSITENAATNTGNTSNLLSLSAGANGTVNGIDISSATGFTNFIKTPTFNLDSSGNITGVVGLTASTLTGTLQTASQTNITSVGTLGSLGVTGNINSNSGSLQTGGVTRIDNSGNLTAGTGSFGGAVTPSLDAQYDFGSATNRWNNIYAAGDVTAGDVVFKNNFRFRENGDKGINILNPKGEIVGGFDDQGNLWMKGQIRQGLPPSN